MPRPRTNKVHPYIQTLIDEHGCENLMDLSRKTGIAYTSLQSYADGKSVTHLRDLMALCERLKQSPDAFIRGMLEIA